MKKISLVVPCYNEGEVLPILMKEIVRVIALEGMGLPEYTYEVVLVDDGSKDNTLALCREYAAAKWDNLRVRYISFSRNFGKEAGLLAGLEAAKGDYVAVMDADMQDPPSLLPEMIEALESGEYDCAATRRADRKGEPPVRSFFARMFYKIINRISDADIVDGARDFRLMKRSMVDAILSLKEYNRFSKGIFGWVGFRTKWIAYENVERAAGQTKWSFWKLFRYSIDGIVNFSQTPLTAASWLGVLCTFLSAVGLVFIVLRALMFGDPVAGWPSLVCIILFVGGMQFLCIGVMGQYLSKMYLEIKDRPKYIVMETEEKLCGEKKDEANEE